MVRVYRWAHPIGLAHVRLLQSVATYSYFIRYSLANPSLNRSYTSHVIMMLIPHTARRGVDEQTFIYRIDSLDGSCTEWSDDWGLGSCLCSSILYHHNNHNIASHGLHNSLIVYRVCDICNDRWYATVLCCY